MLTLLASSAGIQSLLAANGGGGGGLFDFFIPILIVVMIFYFLVFRPASRERKERESSVKNLKKNDKVVTNAGIYGTVTNLDDETVVLKIDDKNNVRVKFSRQAIWQVLSSDDKQAASDKKEAQKAGAKA